MKYPIYIPTLGRYEKALTAKMLRDQGIPFHLVVEEKEAEAYSSRFGEDAVLVLPGSDFGSAVTARNFCKDHSRDAGHAFHWQFDDDVHGMARMNRGKSERVKAAPTLGLLEEFVARYENIGIAGLGSLAFSKTKKRPFEINQCAYWVVLVRNDTEYRWREGVPNDVDYALQTIAAGLCTVRFNAFIALTPSTGTQKGGYTATAREKHDGRVRWFRALERMWPGIVEVIRRTDRPNYKVNWGRFKTKLIRKVSGEQ